MAQKRIKNVYDDVNENKLKLTYDDGTHGEIDLSKARSMPVVSLVGLTLKQAKAAIGIKNK